MLQKQLAVAVKALKEIRDDGISWTVAERAIEEIELLGILKEGVKP